MNSQKLIDEFNKSKVGKVLSGKESFRNTVGCALHGLTYKHPKLVMGMGILVFSVAAIIGGPVGTVVASPLLFGGVYSAIVPKKEEKAACDFLMNVAVRKTAAFNSYLQKQAIPETERMATLDIYLKSQSPKFGYFNEYKKEFPNAVQQIAKEGMKGDLPLLHGRELYALEALQEIFTKDRNKGGILKGIFKTFTPTYRRQRQEAEMMAKARWEDRQKWMGIASDKRSSWREFLHEQSFRRTQVYTPKTEKKKTLSDIFKTVSAVEKNATQEKAYLPFQNKRVMQIQMRKKRFDR